MIPDWVVDMNVFVSAALSPDGVCDQRNWKTLRRLLSTHCVVTTVLPLKTGTVLHIRKPSRPDA